VLAFYPMAFTGTCTTEMQGFQRRLDEFKELGVRVAGISIDSWASAGAFCEQQGLEFPLLSDWPAGKTIEAFGVGRDNAPTAKRVTFIFDAAGVLQHVVADDRDADAHINGAIETAKRIAGA
jgi:peroxiredoxin